MRKPIVLIVDDEPSVRNTLELLLNEDYETASVSNGMEAVEVVKTIPVDLVLMDINLPIMDGFEAFKKIKEVDSEVGVVVISASDSAKQAVQALKMGAYDYITKPFETDDLLTKLKRYSDRLRLKKEISYLREELKTRLGYGEIISRAPVMEKVFGIVQRVSRSASSVLISGESGTGKELIARAIHAMSEREERPFVVVNCGAIPSEIIESELFGHEKGAFTGALARKIGKFEYADGGTVFLDEVGTLPMALQVNLLRVLQERSFERVGGNRQIKVDIRVIAATNIDLDEAVRRGKFREDLYYRLKVVPIDLPPLREKKEDIALLVEHFIDKYSKLFNKTIKEISEEALSALEDYPWPGNVRELENIMERLVVLAKDGSELTCEDLPVEFFRDYKDLDFTAGDKDFREAHRCFERRYIIGVLDRTNWNRREAANLMKIHRNTLLLKIKELGIKKGHRGDKLRQKGHGPDLQK
jgi:DNA-binding NtrC family response regulator